MDKTEPTGPDRIAFSFSFVFMFVFILFFALTITPGVHLDEQNRSWDPQKHRGSFRPKFGPRKTQGFFSSVRFGLHKAH